MGQYIVVYTDAPQPNVDPTINVVKEVDETNNLKAVATNVTPVPADLVITNVSIPTVNYSGESMTFSYTVKNEGTEPGLGGHGLLDRLHLAFRRADFQPHSTPRSWARRRTPRTSRCSRARATPSPTRSRCPPARAASTTCTSTSMRTTTCRPAFTPTRRGSRRPTGGRPRPGDNSYWLEPVQPLGVRGPEQQPHRHAVRHHLPRARPEGDEHHRAAERHLGHDHSDHLHGDEPGNAGHAHRRAGPTASSCRRIPRSTPTTPCSASPATGRSWPPGRLTPRRSTSAFPTASRGISTSLSTPIPTRRPTFTVQSNIGYGLYGVKIGAPNELDPYDLVSVAVRSLGRGHVPQYENEADKLASVAMPVTLAPPPDLQVTAISSDANAGHVYQGQTLDVTYTVTNVGAATPPTDAELGRPDLLLGRHEPRSQGRPLPGDGRSTRTAWAPAPATPSRRRCRCRRT